MNTFYEHIDVVCMFMLNQSMHVNEHDKSNTEIIFNFSNFIFFIIEWSLKFFLLMLIFSLKATLFLLKPIFFSKNDSIYSRKGTLNNASLSLGMLISYYWIYNSFFFYVIITNLISKIVALISNMVIKMFAIIKPLELNFFNIL